MFDFLGCKLLIETKARMVLVGENFIIGFIQLLLKNYSGGGGSCLLMIISDTAVLIMREFPMTEP